VTVVYSGTATIVSNKSALELVLFNSNLFGQSSVVTKAAAGLIAAEPVTGSYNFTGLPGGTYYLAAVDDVNGSANYFDKGPNAFPAVGTLIPPTRTSE